MTRNIDTKPKAQPLALNASWGGYDDPCNAYVGFSPTKTGFTVYLKCEGDSPVSEEFTVEEPLNWRSAARALLSYEEEGLLWGDFRGYLDGVDGYVDEILALCWMRETEFPNCASFLIELPEDDLAILERDLGSLLTDEALELLDQYRELTTESPTAAWRRLDLGRTLKGFSLRKLVGALELLAEQAEKERQQEKDLALAPWRASIDALLHAALGGSTGLNSWGALAHGLTRSHLRKDIEDYVLKEGCLPATAKVAELAAAAKAAPKRF